VQIPAVTFIEAAIDMLKSRDLEMLRHEAAEFHFLGIARLTKILEAAPKSMAESMPNYDAMLAGYLLGLETARVLLAGNPTAVQAGVSI
jgi:hypothetical protein